MATQFPLHIVSPARTVFSGDVSLVEVPGLEGDFGVLAGHAPFFSMLRPGVITIHTAGGTQRLEVESGYADVGPEGTTILSDKITNA